VKVARVAAAIAGAMLTAFLAAGCAAQDAAPAPGGVPQGSVSSCTAFGVRAIDQHLTVTQKPAACQGLSQAQVNLAIGRAIYLVAGPGRHKVAWRHEALLAGARLAGLVSGPQNTAGPPPRGYAIAGSSGPARRSSDAGLSLAALGAWILAAGSGSYILGGWISHGGIRRLRAGGAGLSPVVIFGHFALAAAGLLVWIIFLATGWAALAWGAVGLLLPVAGLGMAMLTLGLSGEPARAVPAGPLPASPLPASPLPAGPLPAGPLPASPLPASTLLVDRAPAARHTSLLVVLGHGLLAVGTILLVLLAALAASGS
jgi:hypothetical protein